MQVDDALIQKLARLSQLQFSEAEREKIKTDLDKMIGFIGKLQELDTTGVAPLMHMTEEVNVLRPDANSGMISREEALLNAPQHDGTYFKVPRVIKKPD